MKLFICYAGKGIISIAEVTTSCKKLKSSWKKTIGHFWEQHHRNWTSPEIFNRPYVAVLQTPLSFIH